MACGLYALVVRELLAGAVPHVALKSALNAFRAFYEPDPYWAAELHTFQLLLAGDLASRAETDIESSGYVIHTLNASLWCLLTTRSYRDCVLRAVNLGGDTDTTGCVAGGLAGVAYGAQAIPTEWLVQLARHQDLEHLFKQFVKVA